MTPQQSKAQREAKEAEARNAQSQVDAEEQARQAQHTHDPDQGGAEEHRGTTDQAPQGYGDPGTPTEPGSANISVEQTSGQTPTGETREGVGTGEAVRTADPIADGGYYSDRVSSDQEHAPAPETTGITGQALTEENVGTPTEPRGADTDPVQR